MASRQEQSPAGRDAFLEILGESQAASAGVNVTEKFQHGVFRRIQQLSTVPAARSGSCFTASSSQIEGLGEIPRKDLAQILKRLVRDRLVVQLVAFEAQDPGGAIALVPFFAARPPDKPDALPLIYKENILRSAAAFERAMAENTVTGPQMQEALKQDLASDGPLSAPVQSVLLDVRSFVNVRLFDVLPDPDMLDAVIADVEEELVKTGRALPISGYGLLKLVRINPVERFEMISEFMIDRVVPKYRSRGNCRKELAQIAVEEAIYQIDKFAAPTPDFRMKRALELKKAAAGAEKKERFAGALAVECVIALGPIVRAKYQEAWQLQTEQVIDQIKKGVSRTSGAWKDLIVYFDQTQLSEMNPAVWNKLAGDAQLLYGAWEQPRTTMHFLIRRSSACIRAIVRGMVEGAPPEEWQVLSMKDTLETYEDYFRDLFRDAEFVAMYGMLLRRAYFPHMPWYLRLLARLGIKPIQDLAFQSAKSRIVQRQKTLEARNRERYLELLQEKEEDRLRQARRISRMTLANRIIEKMEHCYFEERNIPTIGRIREDLPDVSEDDFFELLKTERFQVIGGRADSADEKLLMHPLDFDWKNKAPRLAEALALMETRAARVQPNEAEQKQLERIRKLRALAEKPAAVKLPSGDMDPYLRLEKEIRKHQKDKLDELPEFEY